MSIVNTFRLILKYSTAHSEVVLGWWYILSAWKQLFWVSLGSLEMWHGSLIPNIGIYFLVGID